MTADTNMFFDTLPRQTEFDALADESGYRALPTDWFLGIADIVGSTQEIAAGRYKTVNMVGAAVISAQINAARGRRFPFVFGGDGAAFALWHDQTDAATDGLKAVRQWAKREFGITLRTAIVPLSDITDAGFTVVVARYEASPGIDYAMFSGGGLTWAEQRMKAGDYSLEEPSGEVIPDLTGLSCRWTQAKSKRGVILSAVILPNEGAPKSEVENVFHNVVGLTEALDRGGHPIPPQGSGVSWPPPGLALEAHASHGRASLLKRKIELLVETFIAWIFFNPSSNLR
ncbi:MAG: DUF3095 family protein, partial [Pseudomonadota bacterium]